MNLLDQSLRLKLADLDKMISIKGLVIRTTPIIPDMKMGKLSWRF